ncbi:hypothetical protein BDY21DRAFT_125631 [Lineolata rhizophorae]|uniref:Uncharacterized protein n=1 Tax=Lineolata rhizophorae TaxID=578093 RepID=A0A6A6NP06_9PEZI|nr:hypothetical protein BDY21DRAFT_125631 [Lineolata rhizophorae]
MSRLIVSRVLCCSMTAFYRLTVWGMMSGSLGRCSTPSPPRRRIRAGCLSSQLRPHESLRLIRRSFSADWAVWADDSGRSVHATTRLGCWRTGASDW